MNNAFLPSLALTATLLCAASSCEKDTPETTPEQTALAYYEQCKGKEEWAETIPDGGEFMRGTSVCFYYMDGDGSDLIDPTDLSTLPISANQLLPQPPAPPEDYEKYMDGEGGMYNGNRDRVSFDDDEGLYRVTTAVYGNAAYSDYVWYLYQQGEPVRMDMKYMYSSESAELPDFCSRIAKTPDFYPEYPGWYAHIVTWKVHGIFVYSDYDDHDIKVFIRKANGQTTITYRVAE